MEVRFDPVKTTACPLGKPLLGERVFLECRSSRTRPITRSWTSEVRACLYSYELVIISVPLYLFIYSSFIYLFFSLGINIINIQRRLSFGFSTTSSHVTFAWRLTICDRSAQHHPNYLFGTLCNILPPTRLSPLISIFASRVLGAASIDRSPCVA